MEAYRKGLDNVKTFILKYHYPFIFDVNSKEDMVSVRQKMKLANPLTSLLRLMAALSGSSDEIELAGNVEKTISEHLIADLKQSLEDLEEHMKDKDELLSRLDFSTGDEAIKFLDSMECTGGGDPAEAVLDGMNEVTNLKWFKSNSSLKYVFHLFDAPPHGRQYRDSDDFFPDGCPCELKEETIIKRLNELQVKYVVFPLTQHVNKAVELFKGAGLKL